MQLLKPSHLEPMLRGRSQHTTVGEGSPLTATGESLPVASKTQCSPPKKHIYVCPTLVTPWDSLGKNTGVGCHFLLLYIYVYTYHTHTHTHTHTKDVQLESCELSFIGGKNKDCSPGGSISDSSERLLQSSSGGGQYIWFW